MMYLIEKIVVVVLCQIILGFTNSCYSQQAGKKVMLGAYYFDGWTGKTSHVSPALKERFPERMPYGGWETSNMSSIERQIDEAANAGLSFFSFCWYQGRSKTDSSDFGANVMNNALRLYLNASNRERLKFNILVVNHEGYLIDSAQWPALSDYWCLLFKNPFYLQVDGKPLIVFFGLQSLLKSFSGDPEKVKTALNSLRDNAKSKGLRGATIGVCVGAGEFELNLAKKCGFDVLTNYNNHGNGFFGNTNEEVPIDSMRIKDIKVWDIIGSKGGLPFIPAVTLNWDKRPWERTGTTYSQRFSGYSERSVKSAVVACKNWMAKNNSRTVAEKIAVLYAWNEYGEGAWLTPSKMLKDSLLRGVKDGLK
ncbi:MAG: hypothetical protein BGO21_30540 [Dyadobacter sp. 50-39]|uniref:glycoside hydrolase family 99-like domain-containing protein n=1 Tax=Dyadobacter sp. 50-39 TaxID=1895756 RepID=UPI00095F45CE|nr:glycoside hydrolase family 99-like domain-containing protein [Dyadobacter sp. 50-39]OJV15911.1 MAG: hypothetical protein BGO21_30540 [Dyadobacter sp. 50-39]